MVRTAPPIALALALFVLVGCASEPAPAGSSGGSERAVVLPASALPGMTSVRSSVDVDRLTNEVAHADELRGLLEEAGFVSAEQRSFGGGTGAFSRVLARGLTFDSSAGADSYLEWFAENAHEEILTSRRISPTGVGSDVVVFHHRPDACCHNDVPAYMAAWRHGSSVLYLHVGGHGDPAKMARVIHDALSASKTPLSPPTANAPPPAIDLDTARLDEVVGVKGQANGGVYQFGVPRRTPVTAWDNAPEPNCG